MPAPIAPQRAAQTPSQWAVRCHGVALAVVLALSVPLAHACWHWFVGSDAPLIAIKGQRPRPRFEFSVAAHGQWRWGLEIERYLQDASPVVWWLRGTYNELRYRLGIFASDSVAAGRDGWMFMRNSLRPDHRRLQAASADRARFLAELRAKTDQLGVRLLVVVCPDKERIYPELAYADGVMPPEKARLYPLILEDLTAAGIEHVDLWAVLQAARAVTPEDIYYHRDSHWRPVGALAAARAIAARLEAGPLGNQLGPRQVLELQPPMSARVLPDIAAMAGFKAFDTALPGGVRTVPASLLTQELAEAKDYYTVAVRDGGASRPVDPSGARVMLAGTSFSEEGGAVALQYALQRPVSVRATAGAAGTNSLRYALRELSTPGCTAKVLVWEFVERGYLEDAWLRPGL